MHHKRPPTPPPQPLLSVYSNGHKPRPKPSRRMLIRPVFFWALIIGFLFFAALAAYFILDSRICRMLAF